MLVIGCRFIGLLFVHDITICQNMKIKFKIVGGSEDTKVKYLTRLKNIKKRIKEFFPFPFLLITS